MAVPIEGSGASRGVGLNAEQCEMKDLKVGGGWGILTERKEGKWDARRKK